ncbi:hypothetical protein SAMN05421788_106194 [Filimonas lacunae]|uniref:Lipoprotein n=1 Tax=Filimonas lacunae TaxID=477680 RepID=A0A173MEW3_9BACT|nr:hypothetical protein [Filimonas lacunae]BAV06134.1 hypothetical protein FLA_2149 [Filimonas lacunae]SIT24813.1 hypothetical protein SAMN05421788_106194 [Filimonas lacunae]
MRKKSIVYWASLIAVIGVSCQQHYPGTLDYSALHYDTGHVIIFNRDTTMYVFAKSADPLPLLNDDIRIVDSLVDEEVKLHNKERAPLLYQEFNKVLPLECLMIDLVKYKRQYFPFKDSNHQKIIAGICFKSNFPEWKTEIYHGGHHEGLRTLRFRVNLSERNMVEWRDAGGGYSCDSWEQYRNASIDTKNK